MNEQQQLEQERYETTLAALNECVLKGVSYESVLTLAFETGIDRRDIFPQEIAA